MPVRIDTIGQVLLRKELKDYIKSLGPGDTVKGRVLESENGEVTIKATNGQVIKAALSTDIHLQSGQFIEMQIDDVIDDRVYASLQAVEKKAEKPEQQLKAIIKEMGLPATPENLAVVKTLIKNNLPLTQEAMTSLSNQLKNSKSLSQANPQGVIGLLASGNDLRNTNVDVLRKLASNFEEDIRQYILDMEPIEEDNNEYDFTSDIEGEEGEETDVSTQVKGAKTGIPEKTVENTKVVIEGRKEITTEGEKIPEKELLAESKKTENTKDQVETAKNISVKEDSQMDAEVKDINGPQLDNKTIAAVKTGTTATAKIVDMNGDEIKLEGTDYDGNILHSEESDETEDNNQTVFDRKSVPRTTAEINTAYLNNGAFSKSESEGLLGNLELLGKAEQDLKQINILKENLKPEAIKAQLEQVGIETTPEIDAFIEKAANILRKLDNVSLDKLAWLASKGLEATPANLETLDNHINSTNNLSHLIDKLDHQLSGYSEPNLKSLRESVLNIGIKPHELVEGDRVKETLRDLVKVSESIDLTLSRSGIQDDGIRNTLSNVKDNIDFMRQVNQYNNFIQIPLQMNQKNATADLYVYKDKSRSKLIDPENATILVALDLPKSGRIESMIKLSGKVVNATFRLEKSEVGKTIKQGEVTLAERMEARGYQLMPIKTIQLDEFFNLMKMEELIGSANIDRLHFDTRV